VRGHADDDESKIPMTEVLAYEIPLDAGRDAAGSERIVRTALLCGISYGLLVLLSTTFWFSTAFLMSTRREWRWWESWHFYLQFALHLVLAIALFDAVRSRISLISARRFTVAILCVLGLFSMVWFVWQMWEGGNWSYYSRTYRDLAAFVFESISQDAGTLCWLLVMIWILPSRHRRQLMTTRQATIFGAGVFAMLVIVRYASTFLYSGRSVTALLQMYGNTAGGLATLLELASAIAAATICAIASFRNRDRPSMGRSVGFLVLALLFLPAQVHVVTTYLFYWHNPITGFSDTAKHLSILALICWNTARCMPAIALAIVCSRRDGARRESSREI
jgi:hypothetical protein